MNEKSAITAINNFGNFIKALPFLVASVFLFVSLSQSLFAILEILALLSPLVFLLIIYGYFRKGDDLNTLVSTKKYIDKICLVLLVIGYILESLFFIFILSSQYTPGLEVLFGSLLIVGGGHLIVSYGCINLAINIISEPPNLKTEVVSSSEVTPGIQKLPEDIQGNTDRKLLSKIVMSVLGLIILLSLFYLPILFSYLMGK